MLQVTVAEAAVVLIDEGVKVNPVSAGGAVSHCARTADGAASAARTHTARTKKAL
jgi:hypothetical protein